MIAVRANVPLTRDAMRNRRPFLGGAAGQVASDLERLRELDVDHVFFTNLLQPPIGEQRRLLERLARVADAVAA